MRWLECRLCLFWVGSWYEWSSTYLRFLCWFFRFLWIFWELPFILRSTYISTSLRFWNSVNCKELANITEIVSFAQNIVRRHWQGHEWVCLNKWQWSVRYCWKSYMRTSQLLFSISKCKDFRRFQVSFEAVQSVEHNLFPQSL